ncbi:vWA domain-containing protein [Paludisphaera mucosa]|uniref:BatA and WFA domain-containing protein n=1 Tax=Paludisphaera mucosa TaxID=3030827 RepID=A0ABT6FA67_9BACT|nr:BatA and WFA domain-containing protein [Paludisphaera mucosa]MDG3004486.1 BatA and WFA domain-containing protein [Paludisphaera mucosa]
MPGNLFSRLGSLQFSSPLGWPFWAALGMVPLGIVALYFLKLRRRPVRVASTLLWRKSLEDIHVNSLFQRLRRNLLLFLQLLIAALAMLALAGPQMKGAGGQGRRFVLLVDASASMTAVDDAGGPSRLDKAKEEARKVVRDMQGDDLAMIVSFADAAKVVSNYTGDQRLLLQRIDAIAATQGTTSLREALQVAAGLANPSKQVGEGVVATTSQITPKLFIYTDGGFPDVEGFSLGNLEPEVVVIGPPPPPYTPPSEGAAPAAGPATAGDPSDNVALVALQSRRIEEKADLHQVFGRVKNYRAEAVTTEAQLVRKRLDRPGDEGGLVDAVALEIPARGEQAFQFDVPEPGVAAFEVRLTVKDSLAVDDRAFVVVGDARKARVLVVSANDRYLIDAFNTPTIVEKAEVTTVTPDEAKGEAVARDMKGGRYDLVVFDGWRPDEPPESNALYFGVFPPGAGYDAPKDVEHPAILDWNVGHPLMQYLRDLSLVYVAKARVIDPLPTAAVPLIEGDAGALAFVVPRGGFLDAVTTFPLLDGTTPNTTWFRYISFPLFLFNAVQSMGGAAGGEDAAPARPGRPILIRAETAEKTIQVAPPDGSSPKTIGRNAQGAFVDDAAVATGLYEARWTGGAAPFAVNLFDPRESDLATRGLVPAGAPESRAESYKIKIGYTPVEGARIVPDVRRDWWKLAALAALGVLVLEWYIYNRRVYV